ncbi:MAG: hypothetical protein WA290_12940 [Mycobacterium sp.]|jgi:hypothetical protein
MTHARGMKRCGPQTMCKLVECRQTDDAITARQLAKQTWTGGS